MKIKIQLIIESTSPDNCNQLQMVEEITLLERGALVPETLGLNLAEAKEIVAGIQNVLTTEQVKEYVEQHRHCPDCGVEYLHKDQQNIIYRTLFGKLKLKSPRLVSCNCQLSKSKSNTFSPLTQLLPQRSAPEFVYLQSKWSALMSYGMTGNLLQEVLPLDTPVRIATLRQNVQKVAERSESELGPEESSFIKGCPAEWSELPMPDAPINVGIDGGYVHAREGKNLKAGWFEVIVGKSIPTNPNPKIENKDGSDDNDKGAKYFGFVNNYDKKPRRKLYDLLSSQGMQNNQEITFLSDGGDSVRNVQLYLNPQARFILDWFHVAMRLTVLGQYVKGLPSYLPETTTQVPVSEAKIEAKAKVKNQKKAKASGIEADDDDKDDEAIKYPTAAELAKELERVKWYLWHGNAHKALQVLGDLEMDLEGCELDKSKNGLVYQKVFKPVREFTGYIRSNQSFVVNYGDRYRNGERISSSIAESTVNHVISKRFVKKQQQRWTKKGVHNLLQVRTKVLNEELRLTFQRWYPQMKLQKVSKSTEEEIAA